MQEEEFFLIFALFIGGFFLLLPVVRALAERIRTRPGALEPTARDELRRLREDVADEILQLRREVGELGERMDFAERLLAKREAARGLKPGA